MAAPQSGAVKQYLAAIDDDLRTGLATEHTYRPAVKRLVEQLDDVGATNEPKRSACGAPDFTVWRPTGHGPLTLGYIEAKDIGVSLDAAEKSEQLRRYLPALNNLVLTDYLEFRWYVDGAWRRTARLASPAGPGGLTSHGPGAGDVLHLLRDFLPIGQPD